VIDCNTNSGFPNDSIAVGNVAALFDDSSSLIKGLFLLFITGFMVTKSSSSSSPPSFDFEFSSCVDVNCFALSFEQTSSHTGSGFSWAGEIIF
jgi:hypothetical protein